MESVFQPFKYVLRHTGINFIPKILINILKNCTISNIKYDYHGIRIVMKRGLDVSALDFPGHGKELNL